MNTHPLTLPANFDGAAQLPVTETDHGRFHVTRDGARLAHRLIANGCERDLERAVPILEAVLAAQELDAADPHAGNFYWMAEDSDVVDLNAVSFILADLIPMLADYPDRIDRAERCAGGSLRSRLTEAVRAGLEATRRLDVHPGYTNIVMFDIHNTLLGGELLGDRELLERGRRKLEEFIALTNRGGHPFEFNSPTYTPIALRTLDAIAERCSDRTVRILAETMASRIALSIALHLHPQTGRWAGPHGRSYTDAVSSGVTGREEKMSALFADGTHSWLHALTDVDRPDMEVTECISPEQDFAMTTWLSRSFSLGTAASPFHSQSNVVIGYYRRSPDSPSDVFYTRYLTDDKWYGDFYHPTDRSNSRNLLDEGLFRGVQERGSLIGAYAPRSLEQVTAAKAALIWSNVDGIDEIRIGGSAASELPVQVPDGETVGVAAGDVLFAVRPLTRVALGRSSGAELRVRDGCLVLELQQYRGQRKDFWELRWPGPFFQGRPVNAFYVEMGDRAEHGTLQRFVTHVDESEFECSVDPAATFTGDGSRRWRAARRRDGAELALDIDLYTWAPLSRRNSGGELRPPMLDSPVARQVPSGSVEVDGGRLTSELGPLWLYADARADLWVAGFCGPPGAAKAVTLKVPNGSVRLEAARAGVIEWNRGEVRVRACDLGGDPAVTGGTLHCGTDMD